MPARIVVNVRRVSGRPFPDFAAFERLFLQELGQLVDAIIIPLLRRASRRNTGQLRRSWKVAVSPIDGVPTGISAIFYWTVQDNKQEFKRIVERRLPALVRQAARTAAARL